MRAIQAGLAYFGIVFGTGFVLGAFRVPFLVPRLGERWAELVEMPVMAVVIVLAARWIVRRFSLVDANRRSHLRPDGRSHVRCWIIGVLALALMLVAELLLAVVVAGGSVAAYLAGRDPVSGGVYAALLVVFAAMPCLLVRRATLRGTP
jgi:predicted signal transduction protein with EAL and GGDEF domain